VPARDLGALLARSLAALERGRCEDVIRLLGTELGTLGHTRDEDVAVRTVLAEAWLLQGDLKNAALALGRPPDGRREALEPGRLSVLWRLHGRLAAATGEQSRAIALLGRALQQAERAHDTRQIGLAHYELAYCYSRVGDGATVRDHLSRASAALHAAGDRRHLALVHCLSGVLLATEGRLEGAMAALRQAERLATIAQADDVVATVCGNQANVALLQHRHEQALALAERAVQLHERCGSRVGLARALATLGQICVRLGQLDRAEEVLHRALEMRASVQAREIAGAVFDSLAQIHLIRGAYDAASESLRRAREAYGEYGLQASRWYEWSVRVLEARVALRRGALDEALRRADELAELPGVPPGDVLQAHLIAAEALLSAGRHAEADGRLATVAEGLDRSLMPGVWGEYLRLRGQLRGELGRVSEAYHDLCQSVTIFDLIGERHQGGLSRLALGRLAARVGARSKSEQHLGEARAIFRALGAEVELQETERTATELAGTSSGEYFGTLVTSGDVLVERLVDAAALPELLGRETVAAMLEACHAEAAVLFARAAATEPRLVAFAGCPAETARSLARAAGHDPAILVEPLGQQQGEPLFVALSTPSPPSTVAVHRFRMLAAVARQGFELCAARDRPLQLSEGSARTTIETLMPGFICNSAAMSRVVDQIQRLQGSDLTVLITGESGTGKELVAQAIHLGSRRSGAMFLPYNCSTATRELVDSQLFGHRRGSFTGAISDQPGLIRTAAGGTLFLDEVADLPLDVQPKLLRFLEQGEILPVGDSRPHRVDVRVIAATNADLEQRVAEGKFREDLFYRLSVIRIHVPPLRERREEIPHLSTFFLREACEQLGKPDVRLSAEVLDLFTQYAWPGNVRQLRNEIQRAVALSPPGGLIRAEHLSAELSGTGQIEPLSAYTMDQLAAAGSVPLATAISQLERQLIRAALERSAGNISETARILGLTRRGLYLKLRRLGLEAR
jgi:hydrogenase-4 transcriptional activator